MLAAVLIEDLTLTASTEGTRAGASEKLVAWWLLWGDGQEDHGDGRPPPLLTHLYGEDGLYPVTLQIVDSNGFSASAYMPVTVFHSVIIPPITGSLYGPQPTIACPAGAVSIPVGSTTASRQTLINANPGASFCLAAGTHFATGSNSPSDNQTFVGEYGAIIDGTGWTRPESDLDAAPFEAINNGVTGVTIRNLVIQNCPSYAVNGYRVQGWTVEYCELASNRTAVCVGDDGVVSHCSIHDNVGDPGATNPAERGGGYSIIEASGVQFTDNDVYGNGREQKFGAGSATGNTNIYIARNLFHGNTANGFWIDGNGSGGIIEDNTITDNVAAGIVIEIGQNVTIRDNTITGSGEEGILLSVARDCTVTGNTLSGNAQGISIFLDFARLSEFYGWTIDLIDNTISGNTVTVPVGGNASWFTYQGAGDPTPYTNNSKNNTYATNSYFAPDTTSGWFNWGNSSKTFTTWQAVPQDAGSSIAVG